VSEKDKEAELKRKLEELNEQKALLIAELKGLGLIRTKFYKGKEPRNCEYCGDQFVVYTTHTSEPKQYCSKACKTAASLEVRKCLRCSAEFVVTKGAVSKYCSRDCGQRNFETRTEKRNCLQCTAEFATSVKSEQAFCSHPCEEYYYNKRNCTNCGKEFLGKLTRCTTCNAKRKRVVGPCEACGRTVYTNGGYKPYCSKTCQEYGVWVWYECAACHEGFRIPPRFCAKPGYVPLCSGPCKERYDKKLLECINCGKGFRAEHARDRIRKYCSQKCRRHYRFQQSKVIHGRTDKFNAKVQKILGHDCAVCGYFNDKAVCDVHHIVPRKNGGSNELTNVIVLCARCHREADREVLSQEQLRAAWSSKYEKLVSRLTRRLYESTL
jgi:5-methylcytosine-specific restriction endonuclease McrA